MTPKVGQRVIIPSTHNSIWAGTFRIVKIYNHGRNKTVSNIAIIHPKHGIGNFGLNYVTLIPLTPLEQLL